MYTIYVQKKRPGRGRGGEIAPEAISLPERPETAGQLIESLVCQQVRDYNARKDAGQLLGWLTKEEIGEKAQAGKVSFGLHGGEDADESRAVENAIQCVEDGLYHIFAGKTELKDLDSQIPWEEEPVFTLVRLAMLSGW